MGGSSAWAYLTYDPDLDLLFYGTSQPGVWNADMRPGDNKWGASVFARKPDTGAAVWAYQFVPNDSWDFDAASENIPVDQSVNGAPRKLLVHLNKNGFAYTFDRTSGEILVANQFGAEVNWASHIDLATGKPAVDDTRRVHQGALTEHVCPSVLGAKGWEPGSFSPKTGLFYMPTFNLCGNLEALKAEFISGAPYMGADYAIKPATDNTYTSELIAWDATQGVKKWGVKEPGMIYAGTLATAGGLVFYSTQTPATLKAVDATTGSASLSCNTVGNPISFAGPDGKQRIAVFSDNTCTGGTGGGKVNVFKPGL